MSTDQARRLRLGELRGGQRLEEGALADRQTGAMPIYVQRRPDGDELWVAFRRYVGNWWTGEKLAAFVAGWDARTFTEKPEPPHVRGEN